MRSIAGHLRGMRLQGDSLSPSTPHDQRKKKDYTSLSYGREPKNSQNKSRTLESSPGSPYTEWSVFSKSLSPPRPQVPHLLIELNNP